jgi:hypothetical protein
LELDSSMSRIAISRQPNAHGLDRDLPEIGAAADADARRTTEPLQPPVNGSTEPI